MAEQGLSQWEKRYACNVISHWMKLCSAIVQSKTTLIAKVHGANMGPIWGRQDPGGPHVGPMNLAIWEYAYSEQFGKLIGFVFEAYRVIFMVAVVPTPLDSGSIHNLYCLVADKMCHIWMENCYHRSLHNRDPFCQKSLTQNGAWINACM